MTASTTINALPVELLVMILGGLPLEQVSAIATLNSYWAHSAGVYFRSLRRVHREIFAELTPAALERCLTICPNVTDIYFDSEPAMLTTATDLQQGLAFQTEAKKDMNSSIVKNMDLIRAVLKASKCLVRIHVLKKKKPVDDKSETKNDDQHAYEERFLLKEDFYCILIYILALESGHLEMCRYMLEKNQDPNTPRRNESIACVDSKYNGGLTPLFIATQHSYVPLVQYLLSKKANPLIPVAERWLPFHIAAWNGSIEIVSMLYASMLEVTTAYAFYLRHPDGETNVPEIIKGLVTMNLDQDVLADIHTIGESQHINSKLADIKTDNGSTALFISSQHGRAQLSKYLLTLGADVNCPKNDGSAPLHISAELGHGENANCLIDYNANVNLMKSDLATPLFMASQHGHSQIINSLLKHGADLELATLEAATPLFVAAQNGHVSAVAKLLSNKANANATTHTGATPLYIASQNGHAEIVATLLSQGEALYGLRKRDDHATCLHIAAENGQFQVTNLLLTHVVKKKNLGLSDGNQRVLRSHMGRLVKATPCGDARYAFNTRGKACVHLTRFVNSQKLDGATALFMACQNLQYDSAILLLEHGANPNILTIDGTSCLYIAMQNYSTVCKKRYGGRNTNPFEGTLTANSSNDFFIRTNDTSRSNTFVSTDEDLCAERASQIEDLAHTEKFDSVLNKNSIGNHFNQDSDCNLRCSQVPRAACHGKIRVDHPPEFELLHRLVQYGANLHKFHLNGMSCLHLAVELNELSMVKMLVEYRADLNGLNAEGATPLLLAAQLGYVEIAFYLLENGAICDVSTDDGITPLYLAAQEGHLDIVYLLARHDAFYNECMRSDETSSVFPTERILLMKMKKSMMGNKRMNMNQNAINELEHASSWQEGNGLMYEYGHRHFKRAIDSTEAAFRFSQTHTYRFLKLLKGDEQSPDEAMCKILLKYAEGDVVDSCGHEMVYDVCENPMAKSKSVRLMMNSCRKYFLFYNEEYEEVMLPNGNFAVAPKISLETYSDSFSSIVQLPSAYNDTSFMERSEMKVNFQDDLSIHEDQMVKNEHSMQYEGLVMSAVPRTIQGLPGFSFDEDFEDSSLIGRGPMRRNLISCLSLINNRAVSPATSPLLRARSQEPLESNSGPMALDNLSTEESLQSFIIG